MDKYKTRYETKFYTITLKEITSNYVIVQTEKQKRELNSYYYKSMSEFFNYSDDDDFKAKARMHQKMGAITKQMKASLSLVLCLIFFNAFKYKKTFHSAQKFVKLISDKELKKETALKFFANPQNKAGTISDFLNRDNRCDVEKDINLFMDDFQIKQMYIDLMCIVNSAKEYAKSKLYPKSLK